MSRRITPVGEPSEQSDEHEGGWLERRGVEYVPPRLRSSSPKRIFVVFFGCSLSIMIAVYGGLAITLGLSLTASLSAVLVGNVVGFLVVGPMILFGPRTGTNNQISSSAHFGTLGRLIGSCLSLVTTLIFAAIAVWSSGDALLALLARMLGRELDGTGGRLAMYVFVTAAVVTVAIFGHHLIVRVYERLIMPAGLIIIALGFVTFSRFFHGESSAVMPSTLDGFWPTWMLAVVVVASIPVSYTPMMGDYARYIPQGTADLKLVMAAGGGLFLGNVLTMGFGAFVTHVVVSEGARDFPTGFVEFSSVWYLPLAIVFIMTGAVGQATMSMYSSGLDLESIVPKLTRTSASVITAIISFGLVVVGTVLINASDSISAASTLLVVVTAPWALINIVGFLRTNGSYDSEALQAFVLEDRSWNRYWFTSGWNVSATLAWCVSSAVGLCAATTSLYTGPLVALFGGVDVSIFIGGAVAVVAYLVLLQLRKADRPEAVFPRDRAALPRPEMPVAAKAAELGQEP